MTAELLGPERAVIGMAFIPGESSSTCSSPPFLDPRGYWCLSLARVGDKPNESHLSGFGPTNHHEKLGRAVGETADFNKLGP